MRPNHHILKCHRLFLYNAVNYIHLSHINQNQLQDTYKLIYGCSGMLILDFCIIGCKVIQNVNNIKVGGINFSTHHNIGRYSNANNPSDATNDFTRLRKRVVHPSIPRANYKTGFEFLNDTLPAYVQNEISLKLRLSIADGLLALRNDFYGYKHLREIAVVLNNTAQDMIYSAGVDELKQKKINNFIIIEFIN